MDFQQEIARVNLERRHELIENPVGKRVILPDGTRARVLCALLGDSGETIYKVRGLTHNSGYRSLKGQRSLFIAEEFTFEFTLLGARPGY